MLYLQYDWHILHGDELHEIGKQIDEIGISSWRAGYKWAIMTEDELKGEYEVDWMLDRIDTLEEKVDDRDKTIREQDLTIAQLKDEIKTLSNSIQ